MHEILIVQLKMNDFQRVSCLIHVIQFALRELFERIRIHFINAKLRNIWNEKKKIKNIKNMKKIESKIFFILIKIRVIAAHINNSNFRKKRFCEMQKKMILQSKCEHFRVLKIFQNVNTRWNSTCHMLIWAHQLQEILKEYHHKHDETNYLKIIKLKWKQMKYLIDFIKTFNFFMKFIDKTISSTIHMIFFIYNKLFDHLDKAKTKLIDKKVNWKKIMLTKLKAANVKLKTYYKKTKISLNNLYEMTAFLHFDKKNFIFLRFEWKVEKKRNFMKSNVLKCTHHSIWKRLRKWKRNNFWT